MKLVWTAKSGWCCDPSGPHGPYPCGPSPDGEYSCACGCSDYYEGCPVQIKWWDDMDAEVRRARGLSEE